MTLNRSYRVLCFWDLSAAPSALDELETVAEVDVRPADHQYLLENVHEYDVYLSALAVRFDREVARRGAQGRMRLVYTPSTGLYHLDLDAMAEFGIEMRCIKTEFELLDRVTATAELAFALMLAAARKIPAAHQVAMAGRWARDRYRGRQLSSKTLGVLGVGRLGSMMVGYGRGLRMRVIGCDRGPRHRISDLEYLEFDQFAARADVVSIHKTSDA